MRITPLLLLLSCTGALLLPALLHAVPPPQDPPALEERSAEDKALVARVENIIREAQGTPGQEAANFISGPSWVHNLFLQLKGERTATEQQLVFARNTINGIADTAAKGPSWQKPALRNVPFAAQAPVIDGKIDEDIWKQALIYTESYPLNMAEKALTPETTFRVLWDATHLYFAFECSDEDIIAPKTERDGTLYNDDCVEIFLLPDFAEARYWEIIINPAESVFDALQTKLLDRWGPTSKVDAHVEGMKVGISANGTLNKSDDKDTGYIIEVAVPFNQLPGYAEKTPEAGQRLYLLLARFDKTGKDIKFLYNQPLLSWGHNIWNYGQIELVK